MAYRILIKKIRNTEFAEINSQPFSRYPFTYLINVILKCIKMFLVQRELLS